MTSQQKMAKAVYSLYPSWIMKHYSVALLFQLSKTQQRRTMCIKNSCHIAAILHSQQKPLLASHQPYKLAVPPKQKHVFNVVETGKMWRIEITEIKQGNILVSASFWTLECKRASTPVVFIHDVKCSQITVGQTLREKQERQSGRNEE